MGKHALFVVVIITVFRVFGSARDGLAIGVLLGVLTLTWVLDTTMGGGKFWHRWIRFPYMFCDIRRECDGGGFDQQSTKLRG